MAASNTFRTLGESLGDCHGVVVNERAIDADKISGEVGATTEQRAGGAMHSNATCKGEKFGRLPD